MVVLSYSSQTIIVVTATADSSPTPTSVIAFSPQQALSDYNVKSISAGAFLLFTLQRYSVRPHVLSRFLQRLSVYPRIFHRDCLKLFKALIQTLMVPIILSRFT